MNIVDAVVILLILFGGVVGFKKGFTRQLVDTVGVIAILILAFMFKGYVSGFLYKFMPFFNFTNRFAGITAMNILLYEIIAFVLIVVILSAILAILRATTSIFEKILNATIILGIPSKILGFFVGIINNFIYAFIVLYVLSLPVIGFTMLQESKVSQTILNSTPILSNFCDKSLKVFDKMFELMDEYQTNPNRDELNQETLVLLIESDIIDKDTVNSLIERGKLTNAKVIE